MAKLLEEKHGFLRYRQGDHSDDYFALADAEEQPAMSVDRSADWHAYFAQPPRQYADWMQAELREENGDTDFSRKRLGQIPESILIRESQSGVCRYRGGADGRNNIEKRRRDPV